DSSSPNLNALSFRCGGYGFFALCSPDFALKSNVTVFIWGAFELPSTKETRSFTDPSDILTSSAPSAAVSCSPPQTESSYVRPTFPSSLRKAKLCGPVQVSERIRIPSLALPSAGRSDE